MMEGSSDSGMSRGSEAPAIGGFKGLRLSTPDSKAKDAAKPAGPDMAHWSSGEFAAGDSEALEKLPLERQTLDQAAMVIVGAGVESVRRIYIERVTGSFPGDTGWYLGPAEGAAPTEFFSMRIDELLKARPHFSTLLDLPAGTLIVIDSAGVSAVLNAADEDLFVSQPKQ
jgi:hypothetical protein